MTGDRVPLIIDLGCGSRKTAGSIGVDNVKLDGVDVVHNLKMFPYPFQDKVADEVVLSHVLEHFDLATINKIFNEVHRVLKDTGILTISVPHALCVAFHSDPTHCTGFTFETMHYFTAKHKFSYYASINQIWDIQKYDVWGSINLFNDHIGNPSKIQIRFENSISRVFKKISRRIISPSKLDMFVKIAPIWLVTVHCRMRKDIPHDVAK